MEVIVIIAPENKGGSTFHSLYLTFPMDCCMTQREKSHSIEQPMSVGNHTTTPLPQQYSGGYTCMEGGRIPAATPLNRFSVGMQAMWNRPQQNGAANLQLWDGVLVQRLGSIWVV